MDVGTLKGEDCSTCVLCSSGNVPKKTEIRLVYDSKNHNMKSLECDWSALERRVMRAFRKRDRLRRKARQGNPTAIAELRRLSERKPLDTGRRNG